MNLVLGVTNSIATILRFTTILFSYLCAFLMMSLIVFDVIGKYFFNKPIVGTMVWVSNWFMVAIIFMPLSYAQFKKHHITATLLYDQLSPKYRYILNLSQYFIAFIVLLCFGFFTLEKAYQCFLIKEFAEETYKIPLWPVHFFLPIGAFAMCGQLIADIIDLITNERS